MKPFTIFKGSKILRTGFCNECDIEKQVLGEDESLILESSDPATQYVLDNNIHDIPEALSDAHYFDFEKLEWCISLEEVESSVRQKRDALLLASDYTQLPDVDGVDKILWKEYRQKLRDISLQVGFPLQIDWPVIPE